MESIMIQVRKQEKKHGKIIDGSVEGCGGSVVAQ
jgi:hypothetical protein